MPNKILKVIMKMQFDIFFLKYKEKKELVNVYF